MEEIEDLFKLKENADSNICIDYFKCTFLYSGHGKEFNEILLLFKLDPYTYDEGRPNNSYDESRIYDISTIVLREPRKSVQRKDCDDYFCVELKGESCREFESRGGDWKELFIGLSKYRIDLNRIDIAIDDFNNVIPLKELQDKLHSYSFTTRFRKSPINNKSYDETIDLDVYFNDVPVDDFLDDAPRILDTKKGYSATFGNKQSVELQFYDKLAERKTKGIDVNLSSWLRCEMRFNKEKANNLFNILLDSFRRDCFYNTCCKIMYGLIDFKDTSNKSTDEICLLKKINNFNRLPSWSKWVNFLCNVSDKIYVKGVNNQFVLETAFEKKTDWLTRSVSPSLLLCLLNDEKKLFNEMLPNMFNDAIERDHVNNRLVAIINLERRKQNLPPVDKDELNKRLLDMGLIVDGEIKE